MDQYSYQLGNLLLGNPQNAASLETGVYGLHIEALAPVTVAITGADLCPYLNDEPAAQWSALTMKGGDVLRFKRRKEGLWAYLAVRGGFDFPEVLGSKSTFTRGKIGMPLRAGEICNIGEFDSARTIRKSTLPKEYLPDFRDQASIRVLLGPQEDFFTPRGIDTFLRSTYKITPQSDRMAFTLEGPAIEIAKGPGIISEPIPRGAIQVPGNGQPIILLRDAQVTGGYAKIATVSSADMDRLAQHIPGSGVHFQHISREMSIELMMQEKRRMEQIKEVLS